MWKKMIAVLIALFLLAVLYTANTADASVTAYLNRTTWVYAKPSTSAAIGGSVISGTNVIVLEQVEDGWCRINYVTNQGTIEGYVKLEYLKAADTAKTIIKPSSRIRLQWQTAISSVRISTAHSAARWTSLHLNSAARRSG